MAPILTNTTKAKYDAHVIVTSDTCFADPSKDKSGNLVVERLRFTNLFKNVRKTIVSDDFDEITSNLRRTLVEHEPALIITVGGTGLSPRDVTPEATSSLYTKSCSGIVTAMNMIGLRYTPHAALSRLTSGLVKDCLVINFPGSEKACYDCSNCLEGFIEHALEQVRFEPTLVQKTHQLMRGSSDYARQNHQTTRGDQPSRSMGIKFETQDRDSTTEQQEQQTVRHKSSNSNQPTGANTRLISTTMRINALPSRSVLRHILGRNSLESGQEPEAASPPGIKGRETAKNIPSLVELESLAARQKGHQQSPVTPPSPSKKIGPKNRAAATAADQSNKSSAPNGTICQESPHRAMLKESPYPMVSYEQALATLKNYSTRLLNVSPTSVQKFDMNSQSAAHRALYHVLAEDLRPKAMVPPYNVSTMDGYVMNVPLGTGAIIERLEKVEVELIKSVDELERLCMQAKEFKLWCYQVNTGGRLPSRIDYLIVPTERAELVPKGNKILMKEFKRAAYVRKAGSDLNANDVLKKGTVIGPVELSLILSMGHRSVRVWRRPRIGILSTGDELVGAFTPFDANSGETHCVADINAPLLTTLLGLYRYLAVQFGIVRDDPDAIAEKLKLACSNCDILIVTGGASMGSKDWVKHTIETKLNGKIHFGRVNIKPGKPVSFATVKRGEKVVPIFSLPGNPVSAYITALVLVLPFLEHGVKHHFQPKYPLDMNLIGDLIMVEVTRIEHDDEAYTFDGRLEFARAKIIGPAPNSAGKFPVSVSMLQQSSRLLNLKDYDCLLLVGPNRKGKRFEVGDTLWACKLNKVI